MQKAHLLLSPAHPAQSPQRFQSNSWLLTLVQKKKSPAEADRHGKTDRQPDRQAVGQNHDRQADQTDQRMAASTGLK